MKLLKVKLRPECDKYFASYYINLSTNLAYGWRFKVDVHFCNGVQQERNYNWNQHI